MKIPVNKPTTMTATLEKLLHDYTERLRQAGVFAPAEDAKAILAHVLELKPETLEQRKELVLDAAALEKAEQAIGRREKREPLERIFGAVQFCGVEIRTAQGVFRPIPESMDLVEHTLRLLKDRKNEPLRILDLGTGTGCILLALLHALPNATGLGVDLDEHIVGVARKNAGANGLETRAGFRTGNWDKGIEEKFGLIVCNPPAAITADIPLLDPEMREYEPMIALDGGSDGLDAHRHLVRAFGHLAKPGALGVFQVNYKYREAVLFQKAGYKAALKRDYRGRPNCIAVTAPNRYFPPLNGMLRALFRRLKQLQQKNPGENSVAIDHNGRK